MVVRLVKLAARLNPAASDVLVVLTAQRQRSDKGH
jgi:hypothetical protein